MSDTQGRPADTTFTPAADAPQWFLDNIQHPGESRYAESDGKHVHFLAWNWQDESLPVLLLVHGFSGHAHWWSFLAPFFCDRYRVAAVDLPGMGDSDPLDKYDEECFARAILAIVQKYQLRQATIIGHSFGGGQSLRAVMLEPELFRQCIVVDSHIRIPPQDRIPCLKGKEQHRLHPSRAACVERFRLMPPQPETIKALADFIAYHSCTGDANGWHWKFDPRARNEGEINDPTILSAIPNRVDCIYGELSYFSGNNVPQGILEGFPNHGRLIMIPGAHHHIMLDHPLQLVEAINSLLAECNDVC